MKIIEVKSLEIPEVKVIKFARFKDERGYFTETFRNSDFRNKNELPFHNGLEFLQCNEAFSKSNTFRGLHFQWNPFMGKLVRCVYGNLTDYAMDIRKDSPTYGKIIAYEMPSNQENDFNEWIWVPVGFAHGTYLKEDTLIEYFCTGTWNPDCEASISVFSEEIDWSLCEPRFKDYLLENKNLKISEKDKNAMKLSEWTNSENSQNFVY